jgi:ankyrin repeat protein
MAGNEKELLRDYVRHAKDVQCIKYLLDKGLSLEERYENDFNANCEAICNNPYNNFLEEFLKIGGNPNSKYNGRPCFFSDIEEYNGQKRANGYYIQRLKILFSNGADINLSDKFLRTPIMYACKYCVRKEMIYFLLRYHPDLSMKDSDCKNLYDYLFSNNNLSKK